MLIHLLVFKPIQLEIYLVDCILLPRLTQDPSYIDYHTCRAQNASNKLVLIPFLIQPCPVPKIESNPEI